MKYRNYREYMEHVKHNHIIEYNSIKKHEIVNDVFNGVLPCAIGALYITGLATFTQVLLYIGVGFIGYDLIGMVFNQTIYHCYDSKAKKKIKKRIKSLSGLSIDEIKNILESVSEEKTQLELSGSYDNCNTKKAFLLNAMISKCNEAIKEFNENEKQMQDIEYSGAITNIENAYSKLSSFSSNEYKCPEEFREDYKEIGKCGEKLLSIAEENPYLMNKLGLMFFVYVPELMELIDTYETISESESSDEKRQLENLIHEMKDYMNMMQTKIYEENKLKFNVASEVLSESLKKEWEKENKEKN